MRRSVALLGLAMILAGCAQEGSVGGLLVIEGQRTVEAGSTLYGDLFVLGGEVVLEPGARATGSAYVLDGSLEIGGTIDGDVAVAGGDVVINADAVVQGGLRRGGGDVRIADEASIGTELISPVAVDSILAITRPAAESSGIGPWLIAQVLVAALLAALAGAAAPRAVARIGSAVRVQPLVPLAVGVLALIVGLSLFVFMLFTVVLIPVALVLAVATVLGTGLGFVSLGRLAAVRVLGDGAFGGRRVLQAAIGSAALGTMLSLVGGVPLLGEIVVVCVVAIALGAWLVTRFGTRSLMLESTDAW